MKLVISSAMHAFIFLLFSFSFLASAHKHEDFLQCLSHYHPAAAISKVVYTPQNSSYLSVLQFSIRNTRFNTSATPKPSVIITPTNISHIQASIVCSQKHDLQIRIRSGGHDYEGLSYVASLPFIVLDLINFRNANVDVASKTAWVQSGATLGELYYRIAEKSKTLAFPAGSTLTVGVGGHFSGGGYGYMMRNFGLAADHVIDAILIDVAGRVLNRASMGEDLFWAIRGGGGNTYGIVISWKINLVEVSSVVTAFKVQRTLEQDAFNLVNRWQYVAHKLPSELNLRIQLIKINTTQDGNPKLTAIFISLYLGRVNGLLNLIQQKFPELHVVKEDCIEMSWSESAVYLGDFENYTNLDQLLSRSPPTPIYLEPFKGKVDYIKEQPIPKAGLRGLFQWLDKLDVEGGFFFFTPYGGKMSEIPDTNIPFPHRKGVMYHVVYTVFLGKDSENRLDWINGLYRSMTPYVSSNPRSAYVNYIDLDLGMNNQEGDTSYEQARMWGEKYFGKNFNRLVRIKTNVDPNNFFRNEQSVPPILELLRSSS